MDQQYPFQRKYRPNNQHDPSKGNAAQINNIILSKGKATKIISMNIFKESATQITIPFSKENAAQAGCYHTTKNKDNNTDAKIGLDPTSTEEIINLTADNLNRPGLGSRPQHATQKLFTEKQSPLSPLQG